MAQRWPGRRRWLVRLALALAASGPAWGDAGLGTAGAEPVVVTGSLAERLVLDAPYAVTVVDATTLRQAGPMVHLSEALARVPGLVVNNRHNHAQDLQMSSRGFGARAGFGVRGLRLVSDGIPASTPDGQGQVAHFDLAGAQRIEVLRGPFSVLHGSGSGGVVSLISAPVRRPRTELAVDLGSAGHRQLRLTAQSPLGGGWDLRTSLGNWRTDGFRPHAAARRTFGHLRLGWQGPSDRWVITFGNFDQPAQDPLGLTAEQFARDPWQTTPQALQFDTRKHAGQQQAGVAWTRRFDEGVLREVQASVFGVDRSVQQWLAIAAAVQAAAGHGGGVVDFDRVHRGGQLRLRWAADRLAWVAGVAVEQQEDDRRGFENFIGSGPGITLGVTGRLRRDERNSARSGDLFGQLEWEVSPRLLASAGLRAGRVRLAAHDRFLANGDDSGALAFDHRLPVLGLRWLAPSGWVWHAAVARGHESPTLGELAYRADGRGGFNTDLRAQRSRQFEAGAKLRSGPLAVDGTLFWIDTRDEIGVATNAGGRSSFRNLGRTRRHGAELAVAWQDGGPWRAALAATTLAATTRDTFLACAGLPCTLPTQPVPAGRRLAGTQRGSVWAELAWEAPARGERLSHGWGVEARAVGRAAVNDANTQWAPGHALLALRWSGSLSLGGGWRAETLVRIDNATGRRHVGSLIVNEANGRFLEPGPPRQGMLALRLVHES